MATRLEQIPIRALPAASDFDPLPPLLTELCAGLRQLHAGGAGSRIDLHAPPLTAEDAERLCEWLGMGEASATVEALGPTHIVETQYAGVWLLDYRDVDDQRIGLQLEIDWVPDILRAQPGDVADALTELNTRLAALAALGTRP